MKIIFATDQVYLHGGIEKVMAAKANYLASMPGFEVHILTTEQQAHPACYALDARIVLHDLAVNYRRTQSYFTFVNLSKAFVHYFRLRSMLKKLKPDVVVVCNYASDFFFMPFVYRKAAKIKEFHSSRYFEHQARQSNHSKLRELYYRAHDWITAQYDAVVALNQDEQQYYPAANVVVIPNPIAIPPLSDAARHPWAVAAGRIAPVKGFQYLIEAWVKLHKVLPDWQLHIYGDSYGNTRKELELMVESAGLSTVIQFKGAVENIPLKFQQYSMYVMSSETECFPMVLLESLAAGLPVVSFDSPNGPRNIITDGVDGLLAGYKNIDDLAEKMIFLAQNPEKRKEMSRNGRENVRRFEMEVVMKSWITLFNRIHKNKKV